MEENLGAILKIERSASQVNKLKRNGNEDGARSSFWREIFSSDSEWHSHTLGLPSSV